MRFAMDLPPRFDYGRRAHTVTISDRGAMFEAGGMHLNLHTVHGRLLIWPADGDLSIA